MTYNYYNKIETYPVEVINLKSLPTSKYMHHYDTVSVYNYSTLNYYVIYIFNFHCF